MQTSTTPEEKTLNMKEIRELLFPGDISAIHRTTGYSYEYVYKVLDGTRKSVQIESALRLRAAQNIELKKIRREVNNGL